MKTIIFLFLVVFILSCDPPLIEHNPNLPDKESLVTQARNRTFYQLKKEKDLIPFGIGSGMTDKVRMIALSFLYYNEADINKARELAISAATLLLRNVNKNSEIYPHLKNYPFQSDNIQIRIFFKEPNGSDTGLEKLSVINVIDGIIAYKINSLETGFLKTIYEETFEEAAAKLGIEPSYYQ